jgi:hypothetical protein
MPQLPLVPPRVEKVTTSDDEFPMEIQWDLHGFGTPKNREITAKTWG